MNFLLLKVSLICIENIKVKQMSRKLGRNAKCPCLSGLKYKQCCLKKGFIFEKQKKKTFKFPKTYFEKFDMVDLVATFAAISIYPRNHGKNLRIEHLIFKAICESGKGSHLSNIPELNEYLIENFAHHPHEDPPENLFTENIIYTFGNNTVYGGNFEQGAFTLNNLISAIQFNKQLPKDFFSHTNDALLLLLTISHRTSIFHDHKRNLKGDYDSSGSEILFPSEIDKFKYSLLITNETLDTLSDNLGFNKDIILEFTINENDKVKDVDRVPFDLNPIIRKPFIKTPNGFLLASPTTVISALVHFIWIQSEKYKCKEVLIETYHKLVWEELDFFSNKVKWRKEEFEFEANSNLPCSNALFRIDVDKLIHLSFIRDEGGSYHHSTPFHNDPMHNMENVFSLIEKNLKLLKEHFKGHQIMHLMLYSSIGRAYTLLLPNELSNCHFYATSVFKLLCWAKFEDHDQLSFWYFMDALKKFESSLAVRVPIEFLNYYNFYNRLKSFYYGDGEKPSYFAIIDGGLDITKKATDSQDKIIVYFPKLVNGVPVLIPVIRTEGHTPRYFNKNVSINSLTIYLPNYNFDLWLEVETNNDNNKILADDFNLYWELNEAISYWFWQIHEELSPHLKPLSQLTLLFKFSIENIELFKNANTFNIKNLSVENMFSHVFSNNEISFKIPGEICGHISQANNEGERIILKKILVTLGEYLSYKGHNNTLTVKIIDNILNKRLPLGLKKMLLFFSSDKDIGLDPRFLGSYRCLQESRVQKYMDKVIPLLGENCPNVGDVVEKDDKVKLSMDITFSLLFHMRKKLKNYNSVEILVRLMDYNESLVHENARSNLRTPPRLHCYADYEDIVSEIKKLTATRDQTALSLRCLIEHLAIEPSFGSDLITQELLDDLIAIMNLILWWGSTCDSIRDELFDIELSILPSGRVGTNFNEVQNNFWNAFNEVKTREYLDNTVKQFSSLFESENNKAMPLPNKFDEEFANEYGISFHKLGGIIKLLMDISFDQKSSVSEIDIQSLHHTIEKSFQEDFSKTEIDSAIKYLTLWNTGDVLKPPKGFKGNDIAPWRYNRKLSYIQRPLILVDYDNAETNPKILWTPRHLMKSWEQIHYLIRSGRFKAREKSALESQISKITKGRGEVVQKKVMDWFNSKTTSYIDEEVKISQGGKLKHTLDIGDVDVLVIDHSKKYIFSIECKRTESARNSKEMIEQVSAYFSKGSKKGYFERHIIRHSFLSGNLEKVGACYNFDASSYTVISFFVSYEILAIKHMKNKPIPLPMFSLYEFDKMSYEELIGSLV